MNSIIFNCAFYLLLFISCDTVDKSSSIKYNASQIGEEQENDFSGRVIPGAERLDQYLPYLENKNIALVVNQTSLIKDKHLVDVLIGRSLNIKKIFSPEHGFRGNADAGEQIKDGKDKNTGLPILSLYGKNKKPSSKALKDIDVIVFDIQDVGVRFYTYISTLHYVMEAAAENNIQIIVLDRPNPNGHYIDGPVLEEEFKSFVGMHPVPVVYGMTIGEYAQMINGEKWLANDLSANLKVVSISNYTHKTNYILPVRPSPNLPNTMAIRHYPSLCFFEGTTISVGRGTDAPFQMYGHPDLNSQSFTFRPEPTQGAMHPKHKNSLCYGMDLRKKPPLRMQLDLDHLILAYDECLKQQVPFFNENNFFEKLAGTANLRSMLNEGATSLEIRNSWKAEIQEFKTIRRKYLIYK